MDNSTIKECRQTNADKTNEADALLEPKYMTPDMEFMMNRFPAYMSKIVDAYANDDFKRLCEDFHSSYLILDSYKHKIPKDKMNEHEYQKLFQDLESEILRYFQPL